MEQRDAELSLKLLDLHADSRLRSAEIVSRPPKTALLGDRNKDLQQLVIDGHQLLSRNIDQSIRQWR